MANCVLVYMTAANVMEAKRISRMLLNERLVACVNILGHVTSLFRWKDKLQEGREVVFVAKTRASSVKGLARRVRELHSYEVPCVTALPIMGGNPAFLRWITAETRRPARATAKRRKP